MDNIMIESIKIEFSTEFITPDNDYQFTGNEEEQFEIIDNIGNGIYIKNEPEEEINDVVVIENSDLDINKLQMIENLSEFRQKHPDNKKRKSLTQKIDNNPSKNFRGSKKFSTDDFEAVISEHVIEPCHDDEIERLKEFGTFFNCDRCAKTFKSIQDVRRHNEEDHRKKRNEIAKKALPCKYCGKYLDAVMLKYHRDLVVKNGTCFYDEELHIQPDDIDMKLEKMSDDNLEQGSVLLTVKEEEVDLHDGFINVNYENGENVDNTIRNSFLSKVIKSTDQNQRPTSLLSIENSNKNSKLLQYHKIHKYCNSAALVDDFEALITESVINPIIDDDNPESLLVPVKESIEKFNCDRCARTFKSIQDVRRHNETDHKKNYGLYFQKAQECQCCGKFLNTEKFKLHRMLIFKNGNCGNKVEVNDKLRESSDKMVMKKDDAKSKINEAAKKIVSIKSEFSEAPFRISNQRMDQTIKKFVKPSENSKNSSENLKISPNQSNKIFRRTGQNSEQYIKNLIQKLNKSDNASALNDESKQRMSNLFQVQFKPTEQRQGVPRSSRITIRYAVSPVKQPPPSSEKIAMLCQKLLEKSKKPSLSFGNLKKERK